LVRTATRFEFLIDYSGSLYSYGFAFDQERVHQEWLFETQRAEALLFQRFVATSGADEWKFGDRLVNRAAGGRAYLGFVARGTRRNQLFLAEAGERDLDALNPVREWFSDHLRVIPAEAQYRHLELHSQVSSEFAGYLSKMAQEADFGIDQIATRETDLDASEGRQGREHLLRMLGDEVDRLEPNTALHVEGPDENRFVVFRTPDGQLRLLRLQAMHRRHDNTPVQFDLEDESDGTRRLLHLAPAIPFLESGPGRLLAIDELERRLHPNLTRYLLRKLLAAGRESGSQVLLSTHDEGLMDSLRRDEIWLVEKDPTAQSGLTSLAEYRVRKDLQRARNYLAGRFGAVPLLPREAYEGGASRPPSITGALGDPTAKAAG
jgi:AAA15 family ATPase/GTPase